MEIYKIIEYVSWVLAAIFTLAIVSSLLKGIETANDAKFLFHVLEQNFSKWSKDSLSLTAFCIRLCKNPHAIAKLNTRVVETELNRFRVVIYLGKKCIVVNEAATEAAANRLHNEIQAAINKAVTVTKDSAFFKKHRQKSITE